MRDKFGDLVENASSKKECQGRQGFKEEGREDASFVIGLATMKGSVIIEGIHFGMMTTTNTTISGVSTIKGMTGSIKKEKGMLVTLKFVTMTICS